MGKEKKILPRVFLGEGGGRSGRGVFYKSDDIPRFLGRWNRLLDLFCLCLSYHC